MAKSKKTSKTSKAPNVKRVHPRGESGRRHLTHEQEFEVMKLILDKFLWVGLGVMVYGIWKLVSGGLDSLLQSIGFVLVGAVVLMLFMALLVKEFEFIE